MKRHRSTIVVTDHGMDMELPVVSFDTGVPGDSVIVTGTVHGDEMTGIGAIHALMDLLETRLQCGVVHLIPTLNPAGLFSCCRGLGPSGPDLNRQFPGQASGPFVGRLAGAIWQDIVAREPDLVVDLHADSSVSVPYAIIDRAVRIKGTKRKNMDRRLRSLAHATGLTVLHEYPDDAYVRFGLDHSLAGAVVNHLGCAAVTIEAGPRRLVDPRAVAIVRDAVLRLLAHVGLVAALESPPSPPIPGGPWRRAAGPRTVRSGVFQPRLPAGEPFEKGAVLALVRDLDGTVLEVVRAASDGVVVSWLDGAWIDGGSVVATLGVSEAS